MTGLAKKCGRVAVGVWQEIRRHGALVWPPRAGGGPRLGEAPGWGKDHSLQEATPA